jgi:ferredoxin
MRVETGAYEKVKPMSRAHVSEADEKEGIVLLCCIQPRDHLTISKGE